MSACASTSLTSVLIDSTIVSGSVAMYSMRSCSHFARAATGSSIDMRMSSTFISPMPS